MDYVALLKDNNLKVTPQRLEIVQELYRQRHMSIDEIYKSLQNKFPSISLATIYKNINAMIDIFFITEIKIPYKKSVYELTKARHSHVVCNKCNTILDIDVDIDSIFNQAKILSDYSLEECSIVLNGLCPKCK
jgi:Fur family peroxide stress response transcriptional regulator